MYPKWVANKIQSMGLVDATLVFFRMDHGGNILESGGLFEEFHMQKPKTGDDICEVFLFMEGLLPFDSPSLNLHLIEVPPGIAVDAHLFQEEQGYALIVADASRAEEQQRRIQQKHNAGILSRRLGVGRDGNR